MRVLRDEVEDQVLAADLRLDDPGDAGRHHLGGHGTRRVGDQRDTGSARARVDDLSGQAAGRHHGVVDAHPVARALVDLNRRVPDGRRVRDHTGGESPAARRQVGLQAGQRAQLLGLALVDGELGELVVQVADLGLQLLVLRLRVGDVADPVRQVAEGLEGARRTFLDRRKDLARAALDRVEGAVHGLAEVDGQEHERDREEDGEDRAPPLDLVPREHQPGSPARVTAPIAIVVAAAAVNRLELLERAAGPDCDAG